MFDTTGAVAWRRMSTCIGGLQATGGHKLALGKLHDVLLAVDPDDYVGPALLHDIPSHLEAVLQVLLPFLQAQSSFRYMQDPQHG